jgi:hypothetical protein
MFANEPFLKASQVMGLEGVQVRFSDWKPKQAILTEESIYFFNKNEDLITAEPV